MCELFGVNAKYPLEYNECLREFYSHSPRHPHGWGLATFDEQGVQIEKEPMQASKSHYLEERLTATVSGKNVLAHIRYATIGNLEYNNCHPFTGRDLSGRQWTMVHNGTIFDFEPLKAYTQKQQGSTDSERIFLYLLSKMNQALLQKKDSSAGLTYEERFKILDRLVCEMAPHNKLNLLIYDGEYFYVHTNCEHTLYVAKGEGVAKFATVPFGTEEWSPVPMTRLLAYKEGELETVGRVHEKRFVDNPADYQLLYQIFSDL